MQDALLIGFPVQDNGRCWVKVQHLARALVFVCLTHFYKAEQVFHNTEGLQVYLTCLLGVGAQCLHPLSETIQSQAAHPSSHKPKKV